MKSLSLLLLWLFVLVNNVQANNEAIAYELLHYYYAYKIGLQAGTESLATGCSPSAISKTGPNAAADAALDAARKAQKLEGLCAFDEFLQHVMGEDWKAKYKVSLTTDHVIDPDLSAAMSFRTVKLKSIRYKLAELDASFTVKTHVGKVLQRVISVIQEARKTGLVPQASVDKAEQMIKIAQGFRKKDAYKDFKKDFLKGNTALVAYYTEKTITITDGSPSGSTYTDFDADATLSKIGGDVASGKLPAGDYKGQITDRVDKYGLWAGKDAQYVKSHQSILRSIKSVTDDLQISVEALTSMPECPV